MKLLAAAALLASAASVVPVTREVYLMGTRATLATWDTDRGRGVERLETLLEPLERTEALLSTWRADSEVSRLNARAGQGALPLSRALCEQFRTLDGLVADTGGAFDPAIGSLVAAWDLHGKGRVPSPDALARARRHSGWHRLRFDARACTLALPPGLSLDVGAFGKGEAIDRAREAAPAGAAWLIDLGGQIGANGSPPGRPGWPIGIAHPLDRSAAALQLVMTSGSLSTSAGSERDLVVNGRRVGHILDPRTGRPAPFTGAVTVWHERGLVADALSTALFVMGPEPGRRWAEARGIAACYLKGVSPNLKGVSPDLKGVSPDLKVGPTAAFAARFGVSGS